MKTKHTQGQWEVTGELDDLEVWSNGNNKERIALIRTENYKIPHYDKAEANAKLIAAAPEMLNTLFRVHNQIVSDWIPQTDEQKEILESVKNAIKKTGALG